MILQNADPKVGISLFAQGVAMPLSSLNDYAFSVYKVCAGVKELVATYKKNNTGNYIITPDTMVTNRGTIVINRDLTVSQDAGDMYLEVFVQTTAGTDFINLKQNMGVNGIYLFPLISAANKKPF